MTTGIPSNDGVEVESTKLAGRRVGELWGDDLSRRRTGCTCGAIHFSTEDITLPVLCVIMYCY